MGSDVPSKRCPVSPDWTPTPKRVKRSASFLSDSPKPLEHEHNNPETYSTDVAVRLVLQLLYHRLYLRLPATTQQVLCGSIMASMWKIACELADFIVHTMKIFHARLRLLLRSPSLGLGFATQILPPTLNILALMMQVLQYLWHLMCKKVIDECRSALQADVEPSAFNKESPVSQKANSTPPSLYADSPCISPSPCPSKNARPLSLYADSPPPCHPPKNARRPSYSPCTSPSPCPSKNARPPSPLSLRKPQYAAALRNVKHAQLGSPRPSPIRIDISQRSESHAYATLGCRAGELRRVLSDCTEMQLETAGRLISDMQTQARARAAWRP